MTLENVYRYITFQLTQNKKNLLYLKVRHHLHSSENKSLVKEIMSENLDTFLGSCMCTQLHRPYYTRNESSEEEEIDPLKILLSTFSNSSDFRRTAIESESEFESEEEKNNKDKLSSPENKTEDEKEDISEENKTEEIVIEAKEVDEEDAETAKEDAGHLSDPFSLHLRNDLSDNLYEAVSSIPQIMETNKLNWPTLGNIVVQLPNPIRSNNNNSNGQQNSISSLMEKKEFAKKGSIPNLITNFDWNKLHVKSQIQNNITRANYKIIKASPHKNPNPLTHLQQELFSIMNNYQDVFYPERTFSNSEEIRFVYCLHAINHVLKMRTKVLHHNAKILKSKFSDMSDIPDEYRDQGLVRPKVLIIVPFKHSCLKIVELLIAILIGEDKGGSVMNKNRFMKDFSGNEIAVPKRNPKPEDYELTFQGNTYDTFKIGISVTKKTLKLYSEFYSSDIIISSVLGLRLLIGAEGEEERDYDFLASIELLILDQTELFHMQNWDHLIHMFDHLHLQPKNPHGTDFSGVRSWCINGCAKYYRQTLIFSSIQLPEIHAIFNKICYNYAGKAKIVNPMLGLICQVVAQIPQIFHKFPVNNHTEAIEARLKYFINKILPQYKDSIMNHTLIFIPSYFDYVKLRNYFRKEELRFVQIYEYSKDAKVARARDIFFHNDAHFLLYSERFHFFRRIRVKGIRHIIFYAPPTFPHFYSEMCNLMQEGYQNPRSGSSSNMTVTVIYSKYDIQQLSAIAGTERASNMINSDKSLHMVMTGN
ncbi:U3 small nucleolar RNA-associated protein 25 homolog [Prorops nasuta]|uniref:U3 small nucleolar RNA-associated protein 25 homolog n=1 Tax=Prorops nasuta TaxID=863751 RepID=UPI0034CFAC09